MNKPSAYMSKGGILFKELPPEPMDLEPLYRFKELTDEEIASTWDDVRKDATLKSSMKDIQDFAKAILKKAQEK